MAANSLLLFVLCWVDIYSQPTSADVDCSKVHPIGLEAVAGRAFKASSELSSFPARSAYFGGKSAWCADTIDENQFLQIDLGSVEPVVNFSIQGYKDGTGEYFVSLFRLETSTDGKVWRTIGKEEPNEVVGPIRSDKLARTELLGNFDGTIEISHPLPRSVMARHLRLIPLVWSSYICMRVEVYVCARKKTVPRPLDPSPRVTRPTKGSITTGRTVRTTTRRTTASKQTPPVRTTTTKSTTVRTTVPITTVRTTVRPTRATTRKSGGKGQNKFLWTTARPRRVSTRKRLDLGDAYDDYDFDDYDVYESSYQVQRTFKDEIEDSDD